MQILKDMGGEIVLDEKNTGSSVKQNTDVSVTRNIWYIYTYLSFKP